MRRSGNGRRGFWTGSRTPCDGRGGRPVRDWSRFRRPGRSRGSSRRTRRGCRCSAKITSEAEEKIPGLPGAEMAPDRPSAEQGSQGGRPVLWIAADSARRLREISRCAAESRKTARVLIEANLAGRGAKAGPTPAICVRFSTLPPVPRVAGGGFMAIPPFSRRPRGEPASLRAAAGAAGRAGTEIPGAALGELSMGMSNDFEQAIGKGRRWSAWGPRSSGSRQGRADIMALRISRCGKHGKAMIRGLLSAKLRSRAGRGVRHGAGPGRKLAPPVPGSSPPVPWKGTCCAPATRWWSP